MYLFISVVINSDFIAFKRVRLHCCVEVPSKYWEAVCGTLMVKCLMKHSWLSASRHKIKKAAQHDNNLTFCSYTLKI